MHHLIVGPLTCTRMKITPAAPLLSECNWIYSHGTPRVVGFSCPLDNIQLRLAAIHLSSPSSVRWEFLFFFPSLNHKSRPHWSRRRGAWARFPRGFLQQRSVVSLSASGSAVNLPLPPAGWRGEGRPPHLTSPHLLLMDALGSRMSSGVRGRATASLAASPGRLSTKVSALCHRGRSSPPLMERRSSAGGCRSGRRSFIKTTNGGKRGGGRGQEGGAFRKSTVSRRMISGLSGSPWCWS